MMALMSTIQFGRCFLRERKFFSQKEKNIDRKKKENKDDGDDRS